MRIKIINPNTTMEMTEGIEHAGKAAARPGTEIVAVSPVSGPASIESYYDEYLCIPGVLEEVAKGGDEGIDAYVIACYGDPGLQAAREVAEAPIVGIAESSLYMASMLATRFSIVTVLPRIRTMLEEMAAGYGIGHRVVSIRTTPVCVLDIERDPESSWTMVRDDARRAVEEDDAEAVLLGCAGMADFANDLERELDVPVIDGVIVAVKFCESLVDLGKRTSKRKTYKPPECKAFTGMLFGFGLS